MADAMKLVPVEPGKVYVEVFGLTGTGKSALMGEIEIALKALGLTVEHGPDFQAEKNATHADWQDELDLYKPTVVLSERNVSRASQPACEEAPAEGAVLDAAASYLKEQCGVSYGLDHPVDRQRILSALRNRTSEPEAGADAMKLVPVERLQYAIDAIAHLQPHKARRELEKLLAAPATADKLRIAVEALEAIRELSPATCETTTAHDIAQIASETLAALNEQPQ